MRNHHRGVAALAALLVVTASLSAAAAREPSILACEEYFSRFARANRIPGLSAVVVGAGRGAWSGAYGSDGRGGAMGAATRLCVGSVSKTFTSLAILQLAERGLVELDAPYRRYVPWFATGGPGAESITVRQLLDHTSGLDETGDPEPEIPGATPEEEVRSLARVRPSAAPGTRYAYYNKNYRALGYLVELASGSSYGDYLRREIFGPLGMGSASVQPEGIAAGTAPFLGLPVPVRTTFFPGDAPAGGLVMSAADLGAYLLALLAASGGAPLAAGPSGRPVLGPGILSRFAEIPSGLGSRYGLGWTVERAGRRLLHAGDVAGFHAYIELDLDAGSGCAVLCRQNGLTQMLGCYDQLPAAVHALLGGGPIPDPAEFSRLPALIAGLWAAALGYQAWRFARLSSWRRRAAGRAAWRRLASAAAGFVAAALLACLPRIVAALVGLACTWADLFRFAPDLALLAVLVAAASCVRACLRGFPPRRGARQAPAAALE